MWSRRLGGLRGLEIGQGNPRTMLVLVALVADIVVVANIALVDAGCICLYISAFTKGSTKSSKSLDDGLGCHTSYMANLPKVIGLPERRHANQHHYRAKEDITDDRGSPCGLTASLHEEKRLRGLRPRCRKWSDSEDFQVG